MNDLEATVIEEIKRKAKSDTFFGNTAYNNIPNSNRSIHEYIEDISSEVTYLIVASANNMNMLNKNDHSYEDLAAEAEHLLKNNTSIFYSMLKLQMEKDGQKMPNDDDLKPLFYKIDKEMEDTDEPAFMLSQENFEDEMLFLYQDDFLNSSLDYSLAMLANISHKHKNISKEIINIAGSCSNSFNEIAKNDFGHVVPGITDMMSSILYAGSINAMAGMYSIIKQYTGYFRWMN